METIRLDEAGVAAAAAKAAAALARGGVIIYPTDTIYGLGADAANPTAVAKLYQIKSREENKPVSVIVASVAEIDRIAHLNTTARKLARRFLPGPLMLVLPAKAGGTIAVRIPDEPFCIALAKAFGKPYTTTSANISGEPTKENVHEIWEHLPHDELIDLAIDGGQRAGKSSTIVACLADPPLILRHGAIDEAMLAPFLSAR